MDRLTALVLGGAETLHHDRDEALAMFQPDMVIACNHAGRDHAGQLDHWCTMHPELFPHWIKARTAAGHPPAGQLWHARHRLGPVGSRAIESWGGSSGLLCVAVAVELGCTHVVLAGVPMRKTACHYDDPRQWHEARQYWPRWEASMPQMAGRVRSMSGWTADLLGMPDRGWLNGD